MTKKKVAVVVDSTAYIPDELREKYDLHVIPLIINWSGKTFYDGVDITPDQFYTRLGQAKDMPTTSQPSAGEFHEVFTKAAETAVSILCLTISGELSGTYASAMAARGMMEDVQIEVIDSRSTSMGLGFMALEAARAVENGADLAEAAQIVKGMVGKMRVLFLVDTLEFLHRGGRIGGAKRLIGSLLSVKPVLHLVDGRIESLMSVRTRRKVIAKLIDVVQAELAGKSGVHIATLNASAPQDAQKMGAELQSRLNLKEMSHVELSPVIGTHLGPGALGVIFYAES